jgi:hypothetical protein
MPDPVEYDASILDKDESGGLNYNVGILGDLPEDPSREVYVEPEYRRPDMTAGRVAGRFLQTVKSGPARAAAAYRNRLEAMDAPDMARRLDVGTEGMTWAQSTRAKMKNEPYSALDDAGLVRVQARKTELMDQGHTEASAQQLAMVEHVEQWVSDTAADLRKTEIAFDMPEEYQQSSGIIEDIAGGIGTTLVSMPGYAINPMVGLAITYDQMAGAKVQELERAGLTDPVKIMEAARLSAAIQTPLEAVSSLFMLSKVLKPTGKWTSALVGIAQSMIGEGATEFVQQYPDEFATMMALNPDLSGAELWDAFYKRLPEITGEAVYAGIVGALSGGVTTGAGITGATSVRKLISSRQQAINDAKVEKITRLVNKAREGTLTFYDFVQLKKMVGAENVDITADQIVADIEQRINIEKPIESENRTAIFENIAQAMGQERAQPLMDLFDGAARSWARRNDKPPSAFYEEVLGGFRQEQAEAFVRAQEQGPVDTRVFEQDPQSDPSAFKAWSNGLDVVSGDEIVYADPNQGHVYRLYHGTTHEFEVFDPSIRGNEEGQFGAVNYFTSDRGDAATNYAGEGPDLTNLIEQEMESLDSQIGDMSVDDMVDAFGWSEQKAEKVFEDGVDEDDLREIARSKLNGGSPRTLEVFVRLDNPAVVGGPKETWIESFDLEQYRDDATEEVLDENDATEEDIDEYADQIQDRMYELSGNDENQIAGAVRQAILDSGAEDVDVGAVLEDLGDLLFELEVSATELERALRDSDSLNYATDYDNGKLVSSQIIGRVFKNLGFDGIVMNKAGKRFSGMGISEDTVHVHVFPETPSQIKSVENRGTFDPSNPNILYQALRRTMVSNAESRGVLSPVAARIARHLDEWARIDSLLPLGGGGRPQPNRLNINSFLATHPDLITLVRNAERKTGTRVLDDTNLLLGHPIETGTKEGGTKQRMGGLFRSFTQTYFDNMPAEQREEFRSSIVKSVEKAFRDKKGSELGKTLKTIGEGDYKLPSAVRSAHKTVAALNLNAQCPMFIVGGHGCYFDGCYVTGMALAGQGVNFYRSAAYFGEILQLDTKSIKELNKAGGLRINGAGDTQLEDFPQWVDIFKHAKKRGLKLKIITKQGATFEIMSRLHEQGLGLDTVVQPSIDPYWIPVTEDDRAGSAVQELQIIDAANKGTEKSMQAAVNMYKAIGRDAKIINGVVHRKYGFSFEQLKELQKKYPTVKVLPRAVVSTPKEIAEMALRAPQVLQTWMHAKVRPGMYSDIEGAVLKEGDGKNFTKRIRIDKIDGEWRILAQSKRGDIEGKEAKAYTATEKYIKENYSKAEADKIFSVLSGQLDDNAGALCCTIGASVDACLDCTSHCHMGNAYTGQALTDIYNSGEKLAAAAGVNNADEAKVLYQSQKKAAIWRPAIVDVLSTRLPGKSTPANMAQMINAWAKKGQLKEEELEWSGLREWLAEQDGKVSKQDVLDFLKANHVQVQEVEKGDGTGPDSGIIDVFESKDDEGNDALKMQWSDVEDIYGYSYDDGKTFDLFVSDEFYKNAPEEDSRIWILDQIAEEYPGYLTESEVGDTKFSKYQEPGGENYRELLLTLPEQLASKDEIANAIFRLKYNELFPGQKADVDSKYGIWKSQDKEYTSSHFDEPNILAHVRFNERTDADGNRVLFIEEVQSDWHQEGRKKGYKSNKDVVGSLKKKYPSLPDDTGQWSLGALEDAGATIDERQEWWDNRMTGTVPNAPFKKTWPMLAMKRMVRYAAENGFDKIAWTPGDVQADRYDLSKQVNNIGWQSRGDKKRVQIDLKQGRNLRFQLDETGSAIQDPMSSMNIPAEIDGKHISDIVGKDISEKILADKKGLLRGEGLKVGGEGMKGFYDKILPAAVNKFFGKKAWGSARVGTIEIQSEQEEWAVYNAENFERTFPNEEAALRWEQAIEAGAEEAPEGDWYLGATGNYADQMEVWSLPITPEMRSKALYEGMPLFQDRNKPRGAVSNLLTSMPKIIHAFEAADASTPIHELGHILTSMLSDDSSDDYFALAAWAGVDPDRAEAGIIGWTEDELERVARAFEAYVMEGSAPTLRLRQIFAMMRDWLIDIYKSIKALDVQLTDEVRGVFDRMLAADFEREDDIVSEVDEWLATGSLETESEFDPTTFTASDIEREAIRRVATVGAKERKQESKVMRAAFNKRAKERVEANPFFVMKDALRKAGGLDLNILRDQFSDEDVATLMAKLPGQLKKEGGQDPAVFAAAHNYQSAESLVKALLDGPGKGEAIQEYFDTLWAKYQQSLAIENADLYLAAIEMQEQILDEIAGVNQEQTLADITGRPANELTEEGIRDTIKAYKRDREVARNAYNAATGSQDRDIKKLRAIIAKQKQRIADIRATQKARAKREAIDRRMKRHWKSKTIPPQFRAQITAFLAPYYNIPASYMITPEMGLTPFLTEREETDAWLVDSIRAELTRQPLQQRNPKTGYRIPLTDEEKEVVANVADMLAHLGKTEGKLLADQAKADLLGKVTEMAESMAGTHGVRNEDWDRPTPPSARKLGWWKRMSESSRRYLAELRKAEFILMAADGWKKFGPNWKALFAPIKAAEDAEFQIGEGFQIRIREAFKRVNADQKWAQKRYKIKDLVDTLTKEEIMMVALNSGNEGNINALVEGFGWSPEVITEIVSHLSPEELQLVKEIWEILDDLYPLLNAVHKQLTGVILPKVEGRYFPLVFDKDLSFAAGQFADQLRHRDMLATAYTRPVVAAGHRQTRTGGKMPPLLSFSVISRHLKTAVHDITHQVAVRNAQKIISHPVYRGAMTATMGKETYMQMMPWLQDVAASMHEPVTSISRWISRLRRNSTIVALGFKFSVAAKQFLSLTQTMDEVGAGRTLAAVAKFYARPKEMSEFIKESSVMVRQRKRQWDRDLAQLTREFDPGAGVSLEKAKDAMFYFIGLMDIAATYPTWLAGYEQGMAEFNGDHAKAVENADMVVRRTQPVASPKDLSSMQRGGEKRSEMMKLFTMFFTFFSVFQNRLQEVVSRHKLGNINTLEAAASFFWIMILPAMMSSIIAERKWPWEIGPREYAKGIASYALAAFPFIRDLFNPMITGFEYTMTPVEGGLEAISKLAPVIVGKDTPGKGRRVAKQISKVAGYTVGLPSSQINITMEGILDLMSGETDDPWRLLFSQRHDEEIDIDKY